MEYAVLLYDDETRWDTASEEEIVAVMAAHDRFAEVVVSEGGQVLDGAELQPTPTARSLRWTGGRAEAVDGPFAETVEQFGGLYVIEAPDLDQALAWCRELPHAVEVRPTVVHAGADAGGADAGGATAADAAAPPPLRVVALLYGDEAGWAQADEAARAVVYAQHGQFAQAANDLGATILGGRELAHSSTATSLHGGGDDREVTDGPYAETVEQLTGWYEVGAADLATIEELLRLLPGGTTEIRPVVIR